MQTGNGQRESVVERDVEARSVWRQEQAIVYTVLMRSSESFIFSWLACSTVVRSAALGSVSLKFCPVFKFDASVQGFELYQAADK